MKRLVSRGHLIALGDFVLTAASYSPFTSRTICEARHSTVFTRADCDAGEGPETLRPKDSGI